MSILDFSIFRKTKTANCGHADELLNHYQSNERGFIYEKLNEIIATATRITISDPACNRLFTSIIIEANPKNDTFLIDDFPQPLQNQPLSATTVYEFSGDCNGIKFGFFTSATVSKNKTSYPVIYKFPKTIEWMQRRENCRTRIPLSHKGTYLECKASDLDLPHNRCIKLPIIDLNTAGAALSIPKDLFLKTSVINKIASGLIFLNNGQYSCVTFQLKNRHETTKQKIITAQKFGCLFIDLSPQFQTAIQQYIQSIQIEDLRRIHKD